MSSIFLIPEIHNLIYDYLLGNKNYWKNEINQIKSQLITNEQKTSLYKNIYFKCYCLKHVGKYKSRIKCHLSRNHQNKSTATIFQ